MPLTEKGQKILANMKKEYGSKKGKSIFYASINKGTITGAEKKKSNWVSKLKSRVQKQLRKKK